MAVNFRVDESDWDDDLKGHNLMVTDQTMPDRGPKQVTNYCKQILVQFTQLAKQKYHSPPRFQSHWYHNIDSWQQQHQKI